VDKRDSEVCRYRVINSYETKYTSIKGDSPVVRAVCSNKSSRTERTKGVPWVQQTCWWQWSSTGLLHTQQLPYYETLNTPYAGVATPAYGCILGTSIDVCLIVIDDRQEPKLCRFRSGKPIRPSRNIIESTHHDHSHYHHAPWRKDWANRFPWLR